MLVSQERELADLKRLNSILMERVTEAANGEPVIWPPEAYHPNQVRRKHLLLQEPLLILIEWFSRAACPHYPTILTGAYICTATLRSKGRTHRSTARRSPCGAIQESLEGSAQGLAFPRARMAARDMLGRAGSSRTRTTARRLCPALLVHLQALPRGCVRVASRLLAHLM
jgi:hypothetical protein